MKNRIMSIILTISIVCSMLVAVPICADAAFLDGEMYFSINEETNEATLEYFAWGVSDDIEIPAEVFGYPVTSIKYNAFHQSPNIKSVVIPETITTLDTALFILSNKLERIVLPAGLKSMDDTPFLTCYGLKEIVVHKDNEVYTSIDGVLFDKNKKTLIKYPDGKTDKKYIVPAGVETIADSAFNRADYLREIVLPYGVKYVWDTNITYCSGIQKIHLPSTLKRVNIAFRVMHNLTDVYYAGSKETWEHLGYSDPLYESQANVHYYSGYVEGWDGEEIASPYVFQFASDFGNKKGDDGNSIATYTYDDSYFAETASDNYNHDLAKMSLRLAMSGFAFLGKDGDDYSRQMVNVGALLMDIGFKSDTIRYIGYRDKPSANTIGAIAGNKKVTYGDREYTLIALAMRGGNYGSEWGGNFNVGTGVEHEGFSTARRQVVEFLRQYVEEQKIIGDVKLWITGYSRGAATANLTAAYLDRNNDEINSADRVDGFANLTSDNIYAYCFETPAGTRAEDRNDEKYNNIYNIVNQNDFVPMVAPDKWGYGRYGITYYLPSPKTNYDYNSLVGNMYVHYNKYAGNKYRTGSYPMIEDFDTYKLSWSPDNLDDEFGFYLEAQNSNMTLGEFFQRTIDTLAETFDSPEYYSQHLQEGLVFVGDKIMGDKLIDRFLQIFKQELYFRLVPYTNRDENILSRDTHRDMVAGALYDTMDALDIDVTYEAVSGLAELLVALLKNGSFESFAGNLEMLPVVHFPELCLAWMDAVGPSKFRSTRKVIVNCPVNVEVYDSSANMVAAIYGDVPEDISGSSVVAYVDNNGQKIVYLPSDEEFRIDVTATEDCDVTYSVQETNIGTGETKIINYNDISVGAYEVLSGNAENLMDTESALYSLTSDAVDISDREVIENAIPVAVSLNSEGNGVAIGGGSFYRGEYAQVSASPYDCEYFIGWYDGDRFVSEDYTYRFKVTDETNLTAKFSEESCEIRFLTDKDEVVVVERIYKDSTVQFPEMEQNLNYMILGVYTDKEYTSPADPDTVYSEDGVLYVKTLTRDEWVQFDEDNNKLVVYSNDYMYDIKLITAIYAQGRLISLKTNVAELYPGKNEFDNPVDSMDGAEEIRVFVWSNEYSGMRPLYKNCITELK